MSFTPDFPGDGRYVAEKEADAQQAVNETEEQDD